MQIRSYYNPPRIPGQVFSGVSMTQQSAAGECDINQIIARYRKTGLVSHVNGKSPLSGDFTAVGDFRAIQDQILAAHEAFDALSSVVRRRFNNDPAELISFVQDPSNHDEAVRLGLISPPVVPAVVPVATPDGSAVHASAEPVQASPATPAH